MTPIFRENDQAHLEFEGSGVLARLKDRFDLCTAAHVLDACHEGVFLPTRAGVIEQIGSILVVTAPKSGSGRHADRVDIGFVRLSPEEVTALGEEKFLDLSCNRGSVPEDGSAVLIALGYPAADTAVSPDGRVACGAPTMFVTGPEKAEA